MIKLEIFLPNKLFYQETVIKIIAEGEHGKFCLLTKHCDFVTPLIASILILQTKDKIEYVAIAPGLLVKTQQEVKIITHQAIHSDSLEQLKYWLKQYASQETELEKKAKTALAKLEIGTIKQFVKLNL